MCSQEGETNCRNKTPEYVLYRFSSHCCAKHVLVGSLHKQEQVQSGAVCSFLWPCSGVLCVTPGTRQDTSGCNQSSVWLKHLGRDSRGRKSSPGCSALSQCLCHRARTMVSSRVGGTGDGMCWGQPVVSFLLPLRSPTQNRSLTHPNVLFSVCVPKAKQVLKQGESGPKYQLRASCSSPFLSKIPDRFPRCGFFLIGIKIS